MLETQEMWVGSIPGSGRSPGEGNGNPLQYSCLGNPRKRGAWWSTGSKMLGVSLVQKPFSAVSFCFFGNLALAGHRGGRGCLHSLSGLHHLHPGAPKTPGLPPSWSKPADSEASTLFPWGHLSCCLSIFLYLQTGTWRQSPTAQLMLVLIKCVDIVVPTEGGPCFPGHLQYYSQVLGGWASLK